MIRFLALLLFSALFYTPVLAVQIEWQKEPVSLEHNWAEFIGEFRSRMSNPEHFIAPNGDGNISNKDAYVRIASLQEVPNTLVIVFNYPAAVNMAFLRASIFVERLEAFWGKRAPIMTEYGPIIRNKELMDAVAKMNGGGHDLRAIDLMRYWNTLDSIGRRNFRSIPNSPYNSLRNIEHEIRSVLEPYFKEHPETALVVVSANYYSAGVVTHEVSHAQYFNNTAYREAIINYWNHNLTEEERAFVRQQLSQNGPRYNAGDEYLMINEFQAYMTSLNIHQWQDLGKLHDPHYGFLKYHLIQTIPGSRLIQVPTLDPRDFHLSICSKYLIAPHSASKTK